MAMSRSEVLEATGPTCGGLVRIKIGVTGDGRITAAQGYLAFEAGAYPGSSLLGAIACMLSPYDIENLLLDGYDVVDNKPKTSAYRAPGAPIGAFAVESVLDEIAGMLDIDPVDLRLLNAAREGTRRADGVTNSRIGMVETTEAVRDHPHYSTPLDGPNRGRGIAMGFWRNNTGPSSLVASVQADGTVMLVEGSVDIGGSRTVVSQQLAEVLGIPVEDVKPQVADTDTIGITSNTGGSGVAFKTGIAACEAARDIQEQMVERAALIWETSPDRGRVPGRSALPHLRPRAPHELQGAGGAAHPNRRTRRRKRQREPAWRRRVLRGQHRRRGGRPRDRQGDHTPLHRLPGRGHRHTPLICRGPDTGRVGPGHRGGR